MHIVWENAPFVVALIASGALCLVLVFLALRRSSSPMALAFAGLMASAALYAVGSGFEIAQTTLSRIASCLNIEYLGIAFAPAFFFITAAQNTGKAHWLRRPVPTVLFGLAFLTFFMKISDPLHHLYYRRMVLNTSGPFPVARIVGGPYYWFNVGVAYTLILAGVLLFLRYLFVAGQTHRLRAAALLTAGIVPWISNGIYLLGLSPWGIDLTPLGFTVSGPLFGWAIFKLGAISLVPVAREAVVWAMGDAVLVFDAEDRLVDFNKTGRDLLGGLRSADVGRQASELLGPYPGLVSQLTKGSPDELKFDVVGERGGRIFASRLSPVRDSRNVLIGKTLILRDITDQERLVQRLEEQARTDWLTGTMNRRHFIETARVEVARARRYRRPLSLIILDIDRFKQLNDNYGHEFGDIALRQVADACARCLRSPDTLARFGGDEFVFLLPEATPEGAAAIAERLRLCIAGERVAYLGEGVRLTVTLGVAGVEDGGQADIDSLMKRADEALYHGKEAGRDRVAVG